MGPSTKGEASMIDDRSSNGALLERLADVGRELAAAEGLQPTLQLIVDLAEGLLEHCDGVSMMLIGKGGVIDTPASSSPIARESDLAQFATDEGPCLSALRERETIVMNDLEREERWPAYRSRMLALGVRSMLGVRMYVVDDSMGALDLYSRKPDAFDHRSQLIAQVFTAHASVAMKAALVQEGLQTALRSRDVVGQAKGIVMANHRLTPEVAFEVLKRLSQHHNRKLTDIAEEIARTGQLPG